jgi:hypothetical protein
MRKKVFSAVLTIGLTVLGVTVAHAQLPGARMRAKIPFDFSVKGKILPAGDYEIRRLNDEPATLVITNVNNQKGLAIFWTTPVGGRNEVSRGRVVFHRYGESYFLSEVFAGGAQTGRRLLVSQRERLLKQDIASKKGRPDTVAIAAY